MNPEQSGGQTDPVVTLKTDGSIDPLDALEAGAAGVKTKTDAFADAFETAA
jgi:DNA-directed RNA polymerase subunit L